MSLLEDSVRELADQTYRNNAAFVLKEKIRHLQWELHNVTGENPPVIELQNLRRENACLKQENARLKRVINLQARLIDKLRHKGEIYGMDELEIDILNELATGSGQ